MRLVCMATWDFILLVKVGSTFWDDSLEFGKKYSVSCRVMPLPRFTKTYL